MVEEENKKEGEVLTEVNSEKSEKPAEYNEFVKFIGLPRVLRVKEFGFNEQRDFAKKFNVAEQTLSRWKKKKGFWKDVAKITKNWARGKTPNVLLALYNKAIKEGDAKEAKVWFQYVEDWAEKHGVELGLDEEIDEIRFHVIRNKDDIRHGRNKDIRQE